MLHLPVSACVSHVCEAYFPDSLYEWCISSHAKRIYIYIYIYALCRRTPFDCISSLSVTMPESPPKRAKLEKAASRALQVEKIDASIHAGTDSQTNRQTDRQTARQTDRRLILPRTYNMCFHVPCSILVQALFSLGLLLCRI